MSLGIDFARLERTYAKVSDRLGADEAGGL
jgi:hypothetical protein